MTDVYTPALLPTKPSSDDDCGFMHGFGAEASLPLTRDDPAVSHDTTRLCWIDVTLGDFHIHTGAVRALSWIVFMYFFLSDGENLILVKNTDADLVMKTRRPTSKRNTLVIQPVLTHCPRSSSYFSNLHWST